MRVSVLLFTTGILACCRAVEKNGINNYCSLLRFYTDNSNKVGVKNSNTEVAQ